MASINRSRQTSYPELAEDDPLAELTRIIEQDRRPLPGAAYGDPAANDAVGINLEAELLDNLPSFERPANGRVDTEAFAPDASTASVPAMPQDAGAEAELTGAIDAEFAAVFDSEWNDEAVSVAETPPVAETSVEENVPSVQGTDVSGPAAGGGWGEQQVTAEPEITADASIPDSVEGKLHLFDRIAAELRDGAPSRDDAPEPASDDAPIAETSDEAIHAAQSEPVAQSDAARLDIDPETITSVAIDEPVQSDLPQMQAGHLDEQDISMPPAEASDADSFDAASGSALPEYWMNAVHDSASDSSVEGTDPASDMDELALAAELEASFHDDVSMHDDGAAEEPAASEPFDYRRAAADRHDFLEHDFLDHDFSEPVAGGATEAASETPIFGGVEQHGPAASDIAAEPTAKSTGQVISNGIARASGWNGGAASWTAHTAMASSSAEQTAEAQAAAASSEARTPISETPLIETIELDERAMPVVDDLDIPEPELPAANNSDGDFDELAAELAGAFGEMTDEDLAEPVAQNSDPAPGYAPAAFASEALSSTQQGAGDVPPAVQQFDFDAAVAAPSFESSFEAPDGRDDFGAWAGGFEEEQPAAQATAPRRVRWALNSRAAIGVAAAVVVLLGGASIYALSNGGGGLGQPALVKASDEPFKIKPKNPGGTKISDDNNEVYQRAAGATTTVPAQKTLMTTAEAPMDLSAQASPRIVDASAMRETTPDDGASEKSQARLMPQDSADDAAGPAPIAVQAHRVKTFIVKPDGTLVPRENPQEEETNLASAPASDGGVDAGDLPPAAGLATASPAGDNLEKAPAESAETKAPQTKPDTGSDAAVKPASKAEPVKMASTGAASDAKKTAPLAPAATQAASEWSVQIASQPSADAAQKSYQAMAQRYGDLLAGRGVNIVKADISGKGTYYRVRIPSASKDDAIQLCSKLKSSGGNCFVYKKGPARVAACSPQAVAFRDCCW